MSSGVKRADGICRQPCRRRLRLIARLESSRSDATHPPTANRIALLESQPAHGPALIPDRLRWEAIAQELAGAYPRLQRLLVDNYRARLYHH